MLTPILGPRDILKNKDTQKNTNKQKRHVSFLLDEVDPLIPISQSNKSNYRCKIKRSKKKKSNSVYKSPSSRKKTYI